MSRPTTATRTSATNTSSFRTEVDLIALVKTEQDSEALTQLASSHSGIYLKVVNQYASAYPNTIRKDDLADDRLFNLYRFILDYDPSRDTKLCTYIGNRTDWMCKTLLKQGAANPVRAGTYGPSGAHSFGTLGDTYTTETGETVTLVDPSAEADVIDAADTDLRLEDILAVAWQLEDKRVVQVIMLRHFQPDRKLPMTWREVGEQMQLSHECARSVYNRGIAIIRRRMKDRVA